MYVYESINEKQTRERRQRVQFRRLEGEVVAWQQAANNVRIEAGRYYAAGEDDKAALLRQTAIDWETNIIPHREADLRMLKNDLDEEENLPTVAGNDLSLEVPPR